MTDSATVAAAAAAAAAAAEADAEIRFSVTQEWRGRRSRRPAMTGHRCERGASVSRDSNFQRRTRDAGSCDDVLSGVNTRVSRPPHPALPARHVISFARELPSVSDLIFVDSSCI